MFVHLLSEEFQNYAAIGGDTVRIANGLPSLSCTFDIQSAFGTILDPGHLRNGAHVTILGSNNRMLRPKTSGDRRILTDGTFPGNCQFRVVRIEGKNNSLIPDNEPVALAVPIPLRQPRWVRIDQATGELRVGPAARNVPADAARFKLQFVPRLAMLKSHSSNPTCGFGVALTAPNQGQGQLRYDIELDRPAQAPLGSVIAAFFEHRPSGSRLSLTPIGAGNAPTNANEITMVVPPGERTASFFVIGLDPPNACQIFKNYDAISDNAPPVVFGKVRAKAPAWDMFPTYAGDGSFPIQNSFEEIFTGVAVHSTIAILVNDKPLLDRMGFPFIEDPIEHYGTIHAIGAAPNGLKVRFIVAELGRLAPQSTFTLSLIPSYIDRDDFPRLASSAGPQISPSNVSTFTTDAQGRFAVERQLTGFSVEKPQMMCVRIEVSQVGTGKLFTDRFAIEVQP